MTPSCLLRGRALGGSVFPWPQVSPTKFTEPDRSIRSIYKKQRVCKTTTASDPCVEEPRGQSRSGERDGFPETLEQGQFLDHFHIHSGKWVHGKRSRNRDCRWRKWLGSHGSRGFWRKRSRRPGHLLPEHLWGPATSLAILCVTSRAG